MMEKSVLKVQKVGSSSRRSFCSDQYPSGRSQKVSIGIMVEKTPKMGSVVRKEDGAVPDRGIEFSCQRKVVEEPAKQLVEENKRPEIVETLEVKQVDDKCQKASEWLSSRSVRHETPTTESVQFYVNRASVVQSGTAAHRKLDTVVYGKRKEKGEATGEVEKVVEELAFATRHEVHVLHKGVGREETEKVTERNNEALRMKLWEILGPASQNKHTVNSLNPEDGNENMNINPEKECNRSKVSHSKHNSDTIETDSESPNQATRRPITRSLTRRRAPPNKVRKLPGRISGRKKPLSSPASELKLKFQENNIFAFDGEGKAEILEMTVTGHASKSKARRYEQKTAGTESQRVYPCWPWDVHKGQQPNEKGKTMDSPEEASLHSKETEISHSPHSQCKTDSMQDKQKKVIRSPSKIYSSRHLIPDKILQYNEKEMPLSDRISLHSRETGCSTLRQSKKSFVQTSLLRKKAENEQKTYSLRRLAPERKFSSSRRDQMLPSPDRTSVQSKEVPNDSNHSKTNVCKDFGELPFPDDAENHEIAGRPLLGNRTQSKEHVTSPAIPNDSYLHRKVSSPPLKRKKDTSDDFCSPTFAMSPAPPSSAKLVNEGFNSPVLAQPNNSSGIGCSSKNFDDSRPGSYGTDANTESSDDSTKINGLRGTEFQHMNEKNRKESSPSPVEDHETESSGADDFMQKDFRCTHQRFLDPDSPEKSASALPQNRSVLHRKSETLCSSLRQDENLFRFADSLNKSPNRIHLSKTVIGPENIELKATKLPKTSKKYPEDNLESDVVELALVLERFKAKLKSQTGNKCSEILTAVGDEIRLHLHNIESQIQADMGKFVNSGKSKRKRLESRLQEQQDRLRVLHEKFKEDVIVQVQGCRSTLEELEAHRLEIKGSSDRQKASYRQLLLKVEEAMKAELRDAETNIAAIDKEARKKMHGLKYVLKEWMEDGVIR